MDGWMAVSNGHIGLHTSASVVKIIRKWNPSFFRETKKRDPKDFPPTCNFVMLIYSSIPTQTVTACTLYYTRK